MSIPYNFSILKWARKDSNYSLEEIANKMNKDLKVIEEWETGISSPTYVQLETLAYQIYKKPLAIFFFPELPKNDYINRSFRTIAEYELQQLEPKFKQLINKAYAYQLNIKELTNNFNPSTNQIIKNLKLNHEMTTFDMVEELRIFLNITLGEQFKYKDTTDALRKWIEKLEEVGIFVFKDAFRNNNYSGFCLYDDEIPVIYLNSSKSKSRQIFTLFHELAHLLFNTSGIDSKKHIDYYQGVEETIEIHCNRFAGEFLIPDYDFEHRIQNIEINEISINRLAGVYKVSREAILRKFLKFKVVTKEYYEEKRVQWNKEFIELKKKQNGGPSHIQRMNTYLSINYKDIVINNYNKKVLTRDQVISYLSISDKHLNKFVNNYLNRGKK